MSEFAWTQQQRVDMERHRAVRAANEWIREGDRAQAVQVLLDSVHKQLRWSEPEEIVVQRMDGTTEVYQL